MMSIEREDGLEASRPTGARGKMGDGKEGSGEEVSTGKMQSLRSPSFEDNKLQTIQGGVNSDSR